MFTRLLKSIIRTLSNERGCWGNDGGGDYNPPAAAPPAVTPAPVPSPIPADTAPQESADQKRSKISAMRYGMLSTIRNVGGAAGISGTGADLSSPAAQGQKRTFGA